MNKGIIIDLDGTLADVSHRVHHVEKEVKDKKAFNQLMGKDSLNHWCYELMEAMRARGYKIIFITGRPEKYWDDTTAWLDRNKISYDELYMRPRTAKGTDDLVKKNIYENSIRNRIDIAFIVEDRLSVVRMWREIGLVCLQCDWGDF